MVVIILLIFFLSNFIVDEMYVLSASNRRVSVQLVGKDKIQDKLSRFEELTSASLYFLGVSCSASDHNLSSVVPSKLTKHGNLMSPRLHYLIVIIYSSMSEIVKMILDYERIQLLFMVLFMVY